jgi:4-amino-4-deoxy-L-arabinose transferase-like glycosyltransferase
MPRWSVSAWGAICVSLCFIGLTWWWLTQDRSIPIYDAGTDLARAIYYRQLIQGGDLLGPFNHVIVYPPLGLLIGSLATFIGGVNVASPILGENIVFVSLLTLGCYQTGRLLFGARTGLLAAILVLGSPLLIAQFHVFMLDAPETAMVAVSMWLLLASADFGRTRVAALAGLAVGCGLLVKVQFPFFLAGIVLVALARGGWRHWHGVTVFAAIAFAVGAPWYIDHLSELGAIMNLAGNSLGASASNASPVLSMTNLSWYLWSTLNSQLLAPLFLLVLGGALWTLVALARRQEMRGPRLEFMVGGFVAWLAITLTPHHDIRYDMPLMPYLAVLGTGWIVYLPRAARVAAIGVLVLSVVANTIGTTFGVGEQVELKLVGSGTQALPDRIVVYSNKGFLVAGPQRDGDVLNLMRSLRRSDVRMATLNRNQSYEPDFSIEGLYPLSRIAGMLLSFDRALVRSSSRVVAFVHHEIPPEAPPPCTRLSDETGVWLVRRNPQSGKLMLFCPFRHPEFYR